MAGKPGQILRNNELSAISTGLRRATMHLGRRLRHERARDALSSTKLSVLGALQRRGELSPGELSDADRIQPQSLTRTLAALQADGLIARRSDPADRRRSLVALTARGRDALEHDMAQRDRW